AQDFCETVHECTTVVMQETVIKRCSGTHELINDPPTQACEMSP
ncbi:183_t:CDS:1, partial [Cetraspora pellucida]